MKLPILIRTARTADAASVSTCARSSCTRTIRCFSICNSWINSKYCCLIRDESWSFQVGDYVSRVAVEKDINHGIFFFRGDSGSAQDKVRNANLIVNETKLSTDVPFSLWMSALGGFVVAPWMPLNAKPQLRPRTTGGEAKIASRMS